LRRIAARLTTFHEQREERPLEPVRRKILIVEDEGIIAIDLKRKLVESGYAVTAVATCAAEALAALELERPDLVLMDIRLRGPEDGIETAERVRLLYRLPVMFVTAHADPETLERAKITQPFGYIVKPFGNVNLHAQIEMALWKHAMEQKLRASEAWLSTTFRNVTDALITTDTAGNIVLMNAPAAALTGWEPDQAKGRGLFEVFKVFDEKTGLPAVHPLEAIFDDRQVDTASALFRLFNRSEAYVLVEAEMCANRDEQGTLLGIICVFRDVTERRKAEEQERQLQKKNAIGVLAAGLAGELARTQSRMDEPLSELLYGAKGQRLRLLEEINKHSTYQQNLVCQLAALGRTEKGPPVMVNLNEMLTALESQFTQILGRARPLNLRLEPDLPFINVESEELRENLVRLVTEAREATPDGGPIDIATESIFSARGKERVQISIHDSGKRIRAGARMQAFDPYYQSRPGSRNPGMSLALVHQFVILNGGSIEIETAEGFERGATFLVRFPAVASSQAPSGEEDESGLSASA
jgi:two-component system, cell cycle sensor histidine kinase and response regulator CckA